jgi:hypothetical protein
VFVWQYSMRGQGVSNSFGEIFLSKEIMGELLKIAREAAYAGVQVAVRTYKAA